MEGGDAGGNWYSQGGAIFEYFYCRLFGTCCLFFLCRLLLSANRFLVTIVVCIIFVWFTELFTISFLDYLVMIY